MKSYSLFSIFILCVAIVLVDAFAFYWLQSILQIVDYPSLKLFINSLFWVFTFGLVSAIMLLKMRMNAIPVGKRQMLISSLYGLTISSFVPKILFSLIISVLYYSNYIFSETDSVLIVPIFGLIAGFLPFFAIVYAIFKSAYRFKIHRVEVHSKDLPSNFDGLKIVHISDLHVGSFSYRYRILEKVVHLINDLNADLILFTGDLVNNYAWELKGWDQVLNKLSAKKGKFAVLGNHDYGDYSPWISEEAKKENFEEIKNFYQKIDFQLLLNASEVLTEDNQSIGILGVENWGLPPFRQDGDLQKAWKDVRNLPFKILLSHDPSHWDAEVIDKTDIDLTLSGHTHGMQAGIKIMGKQWSPIQYKYKRWAGLYAHKKQYLYVTRGLGWLGFPGRMGMRPEITLIELKK
ncbi:MAG: metallophosphoesterase [Weeksellaceae bacterium]